MNAPPSPSQGLERPAQRAPRRFSVPFYHSLNLIRTRNGQGNHRQTGFFNDLLRLLCCNAAFSLVRGRGPKWGDHPASGSHGWGLSLAQRWRRSCPEAHQIAITQSPATEQTPIISQLSSMLRCYTWAARAPPHDGSERQCGIASGDDSAGQPERM